VSNQEWNNDQAHGERVIREWRKEIADRDATIDALKAEVERLREYERLLADHPRCAKLLRSGRPFFVVAGDEPYAKCVAALIKNVEDGRGTWTDADETRVAAILHVDVVDKAPPNAHTRLKRAQADLARHQRALAAGPAALRQMAENYDRKVIDGKVVGYHSREAGIIRSADLINAALHVEAAQKKAMGET